MTKMTKRTLSIALSVLLLLTAFTGFALASAITIVEQPEAIKGYKGETATFSVEAEGDDLSYQWQMRAKKGEAYKNIKGANEASYTTPKLLNSHSHRRFQVVITDGDGHEVVSKSVNLIVRPASIRITEDPSPQKVEEGETATYSVKAEGPGSLSYQWQKRLPGEKEYLNIDDANEASYTTGEVSLADKHSRFRCVVTTSTGLESISGSANLMVLEKKEEPTEAPSEEPSEDPDATSSSAPGATSTPGATATATAAPTATATATAAPTAAPGGGGGGGGGGGNTNPTPPPSNNVTSVSITPETLLLAIRGSSTLTANVLPADAANTAVTWSSADTSIATVSATGLVTGVAPGTTIITATSQADSSIFGRCAVTVENLVKLDTPTNLRIDSNGELSWDAVTGAQIYEVNIYLEGNLVRQSMNAGPGNTYIADATAFNWDEGNYVFSVLARSSGTYGVISSNDSDESEKSTDSIRVEKSGAAVTIDSVDRDTNTQDIVMRSSGFNLGDKYLVWAYRSGSTSYSYSTMAYVLSPGELRIHGAGSSVDVSGVSVAKVTWAAGGASPLVGTLSFGAMSEKATVAALTVTGIDVAIQPRLIYAEGDRLDLSDMRITITYDDGSTATAIGSDIDSFGDGYALTSNPRNDTELTLADDGIQVVITYQINAAITATTSAITVTVRQSDTAAYLAAIASLPADNNDNAYTTDSWALFLAAKAGCDLTLDGTASAADLALQTVKINDARGKLVGIDAGLTAAIATAPTSGDGYSAASYADVVAALALPESTNAEKQAKINAISAAVSNLADATASDELAKITVATIFVADDADEAAMITKAITDAQAQVDPDYTVSFTGTYTAPYLTGSFTVTHNTDTSDTATDSSDRNIGVTSSATPSVP